jgi:hypothetical protein
MPNWSSETYTHPPLDPEQLAALCSRPRKRADFHNSDLHLITLVVAAKIFHAIDSLPTVESLTFLPESLTKSPTSP